MDADGNVLAKGGERTIDGFGKMMAAASETQTELDKLSKKAQSGDQKAMIALFEKRLELSHYDAKSAKAAFEKLGKLDDEELAKSLQQKIVGLEVMDVFSSIGSAADYPDAAKKLAGLWKAGRVPDPKGNLGFNYWGLMVTGSIMGKDKKTASDALAEFEKHFGDNRRYQQYIKRWKQQIEKLDG